MDERLKEDWQEAGFGIYVHWPFCQSKCPYCDFNSHVRTGGPDQARWAKALEGEVRAQADLTPGRRVDTVFFGGGTPSLMAPETVGAVLEAIRTEWDLAENVEVSLEANPGSVEAGRFKGYADAGVNRISMGIQALNDRDLKALGRLHSVAEASQAYDIARKYFDRVSFDLIYGRAEQTRGDWEVELKEALSMAVDHLSLYMLTIEPGTRFGDLYDRGRLRGLPDDDLSADLYALTQDICGAAGMPGYEISNHARGGAESRHNLIYWRYGDYAGIGPGAHGRLTVQGEKIPTTSEPLPEAWLERVEDQGQAFEQTGAIPPSEQAVEYAMMALRLSEGLCLDRYEKLAGTPVDSEARSSLEAGGFIKEIDGRLMATDRGKPVLNAILGALLT